MTDFIGEVEQELLDATNFKPERSYRDRQKYLDALLRACAGLNDDQFDRLSDPAADWCNEAAGANKDGFPIPDFKSNGTHGPHRVIQSHRPGVEDTDEPQAYQGQEAQIQTEAAEVPSEEHGQQGVVEPEKKIKKKGGRPKGSKTKKGSVPIKLTVAKPKARKPRTPRPTASENIARKAVMGVNLWGVTVGCKADIACKMAAQTGGASMKEIKDATGGSKYNLFNRLQKNGYDLKWEGGRIYLAKPVKLAEQSEQTE